MAKKTKAPDRKLHIPFTGVNYALFFIGLVVIAIGYYLQTIGPANSLESRTLAPIVLVIAYLVIIPIAILWRPRKD
jgi:membrane protein YdbS with pleckstrin-like domain